MTLLDTNHKLTQAAALPPGNAAWPTLGAPQAAVPEPAGEHQQRPAALQAGQWHALHGDAQGDPFLKLNRGISNVKVVKERPVASNPPSPIGNLDR